MQTDKVNISSDLLPGLMQETIRMTKQSCWATARCLHTNDAITRLGCAAGRYSYRDGYGECYLELRFKRATPPPSCNVKVSEVRGQHRETLTGEA